MPSGYVRSVACRSKFCNFAVFEEDVVSTVVDLDDSFWSAWVSEGVGAVGKFVQVAGTNTLGRVREQAVCGSCAETVDERVVVVGWHTEDARFGPCCWAGCARARTRGSAWEDFTDERRRRGET